MATKIQLRRDNTSTWSAANPVLAEGEIGVNLENNGFKLGDGVKTWNQLPYSIDVNAYQEFVRFNDGGDRQTISGGGGLTVSGNITATTFTGDGSGLANTGAALSTTTGTQRLVMTSLTSGTMITASTDAGLSWDSSNDRLSVTGNITATTFTGDGSGLANTGSTLTGASGTQRVVLTSLTSGTMTSSTTDGDLTFNASTNTLNCANFNSTSDISLKENIRMVDSPLTILKDIEGVRFDWKETGNSTLGVVAQNVETVLPELVSENEGIKSVNYNGLIAVLIESIKEQQKQIDDLKEQVQSLSK